MADLDEGHSLPAEAKRHPPNGSLRIDRPLQRPNPGQHPHLLQLQHGRGMRAREMQAGPNLPREFRELRCQVGPAAVSKGRKRLLGRRAPARPVSGPSRNRRGQGPAQLEQKLELRSTASPSVPAISGKNLQRRRSHVEDILVRNPRRFSREATIADISELGCKG